MRTFLLAIAIVFSTALSAFAQHVTVKIHSLEKYGPAERAYALQAAQMLERLINSDKFRDTLRLVRYKGGENPQSVYDAIIKAKEIKAPYLDSTAEHVVDLWLRLDGTGLNCNGSSIGGDDGLGGYTNSCPNRIQCWAANDCVALMAGHLMHEYMHQLGYNHFGWGKTKKVPYVVGNVVVALLTASNGEFKLKRCAEWPGNTGPCQH